MQPDQYHRDSIIGKLPVVRVGDTETIPCGMGARFPSAHWNSRPEAGDGCRLWYFNSCVLRWSRRLLPRHLIKARCRRQSCLAASGMRVAFLLGLGPGCSRAQPHESTLDQVLWSYSVVFRPQRQAASGSLCRRVEPGRCSYSYSGHECVHRSQKSTKNQIIDK